MIVNVANCILSASVGTGIAALVTIAGSVGWAVGVEDALGSASGVRVTVVLGEAGAGSVATLGVGSAGRWGARISWFFIHS